MKYLSGGFASISSAANIPHERVFIDNIPINQEGYVYIYLSNESASMDYDYWDDFKVTHTLSGVVQQDDYYPFGLTHGKACVETPENKHL